MNTCRLMLWVVILVSSIAMRAPAAPLEGELELSAIDRDTGEPIAVRVHLINAATKKPVKVPGVPTLGDHFVFHDKVKLKLPLGSYQFVMERGPEYLVRSGHFTINNYASDRKTVDMKRFVDMAAEGWYAGDLDVRRGDRDIELLMQAEDLYIAQVLSWSNNKATQPARPRTEKSAHGTDPVIFDGRRFYSALAGEAAREGSALLFFNLREPFKLAISNDGSHSSSLEAAAHDADGWVEAAAPTSWDLPVWMAEKQLDSVQVVHRHLLRNGGGPTPDGRPPDAALYPGAHGNGRWSLDIYYHLLNCGLRLPPTAGSGSGWTPKTTAAPGTAAAIKAAASGNFNPVGYNRVYVYVDGDLTWEKWWEGLRAGRAVITNGPLIRPTVEGQPPGYIFQGRRGETLELEIGLSLSMRDHDKVSYLEIIKDGAVEHSVRLDKWKANQGKLPLVKFTESGWFLVRAVTDVTSTYRYAMTAPYYVDIDYQPRISRTSAQFFVDWCRERVKQLSDSELRDQWRRTEDYWATLVNRANAP